MRMRINVRQFSYRRINDNFISVTNGDYPRSNGHCRLSHCLPWLEDECSWNGFPRKLFHDCGCRFRKELHPIVWVPAPAQINPANRPPRPQFELFNEFEK